MISKRCQNLKPSPTLSAAAKAQQMRREGIDVIPLNAGEPDFDTPNFVKASAIDALNKGFTKYTPSSGIPELKDAICQKLKNDNGIDYNASQIIVTVGAKQAIYNALMAIVDEGDEVILFAPFWATYADQVGLAGGKPVIVQTTASNNFIPDIKQVIDAITPKTKALMINSPSNPTGAVLSPDFIKELAHLAVKHNFWILSDEIYEKIIYDGAEFLSPASISPEVKEKVITINGLSKSHAMTGWRIGYAAAPNAVADAMKNIQDQVTSNPVSFAQKGAVTALTTDDSVVKEMVVAFKERRDYIVQALNALPNVKCPKPLGAFYAFPDFSAYYGKKYGDKVIADSYALADYLLTEARVSTVAGSAFYGNEYIRISYATSMDNIKKGIERIEEALAKLV